MWKFCKENRHELDESIIVNNGFWRDFYGKDTLEKNKSFAFLGNIENVLSGQDYFLIKEDSSTFYFQGEKAAEGAWLATE